MKTENEKKQLTEEEIETAWRKLWQFANDSIDVADIHISYKDFVSEGKKLFEIKEKVNA
jgi:hypothetical protein